MDRDLTVLDAYTKRVYKIIMLIVPFSCIAASVIITYLNYRKLYIDINMPVLTAFDLLDLSFLIVGIFFIKTGFDRNGLVKKKKLISGKYTMALIAIIQWNFISYMCPFRDLWAFCLLFTLGEAFFFDIKLVGFTSVGLTLSTLISWILRGEYLLPVRDDYFLANMVFRIACIILTMACINVITYMGGKFLVEELEKYVYNDPLTHLLTRRKMNAYLKEAYDEASKFSKPFCIMMFDIDDFKQVNDTYGHACGDEVLKTVADVVSSNIEKNDKAFRWGGEEILVLMRSDEVKAVSAAERIRLEIENKVIDHRGVNKVSVTVTIGVTAYDPRLDLKAMMYDVDKKLYHGKNSGKNKVVYKF